MEPRLGETSLQQIAEHWARTDLEMRRKEEEARLAESDAQRLHQRLQTLTEQLSKHVGKTNPSTRVFQIGQTEVVVVDIHGIRRVEVERKDSR